MSDRDVVIRVEGVSKLYRLGEVGTGSLAHDVNRWWHKVRGKEDPYLNIGEVNDRTKPAARAVASSELRVAGEEAEVAGKELRVTGEEGPRAVAGSELLVTSGNTSAEGGDRAEGASGPATRHQLPVTAPTGASAPATSYSPLVTSSSLPMSAPATSYSPPVTSSSLPMSSPATSYPPPVTASETPPPPATAPPALPTCRCRVIPRV